jgi:hypothetical protein
MLKICYVAEQLLATQEELRLMELFYVATTTSRFSLGL